MGRGRTKEITYIVNNNGCFICTSHFLDKNGYPKFSRGGKKYFMHRYIYEKTFGEIPEGFIIMHLCDNTSCINPNHLKLGIPKENSEQMVNHNRSSIGSRNGISKLTENEVLEILSSTLSQSTLAKIYNVCQQTISNIKTRKQWKYLGDK